MREARAHKRELFARNYLLGYRFGCGLADIKSPTMNFGS